MVFREGEIGRGSMKREFMKLERGMEGKKYKNVLIKGIMDLYIKTGREEILIDYKSGNLEGRRLLKAQEQLDFYSFLLGDEKTVIRK